MFFVEIEEGGPVILRAEIGSPQPSVDFSSPIGSENGAELAKVKTAITAT